MAGKLTADIVFGIKGRLEAANKPKFIEDNKLTDILNHDFLEIIEDEDDDGNPVLEVDHIKDFPEMKKRVLAGKSIEIKKGK